MSGDRKAAARAFRERRVTRGVFAAATSRWAGELDAPVLLP